MLFPNAIKYSGQKILFRSKPGPDTKEWEYDEYFILDPIPVTNSCVTLIFFNCRHVVLIRQLFIE